jgi:hypothetical protein
VGSSSPGPDREEAVAKNPLPLPLGDPIATRTGLCGDTWSRLFAEMVKIIDQTPNQIVDPPSVTAQSAAIATTTLAPAQQIAGLYRVTWYARITTAAGVASSLTVTVGFSDHGQAMTFSGAAIAGNTVTSAQSESVMFYSDEFTAITYSTAYVSNPASAMEYQLFIVLEQLNT